MENERQNSTTVESHLSSAPSAAKTAGAALIKRPARSTPLGSTFMDWATLPLRSNANGIYRAVFDAPAPTLERFEMHVTTLNPGATPHAPHSHPWEEILIIKEGQIEVLINGVKNDAQAGAVIFFASNDVHTVKNTGSEPAIYFVINFYTEAVHTVFEGPSADHAPADRQRSRVINPSEAEFKEMPHDQRRNFLSGPTVTFTNLKIHATTIPGGRYPVRHGEHVNLLLVIVTDGVIESTLDTVTHPVGPGCIIFLAPGAIQTIRNRGTVPATYYVLSVSSTETPH